MRNNKYKWSWEDGYVLLQHGNRYIKLGKFPAAELKNRDACLAWAFQYCKESIDRE